MKRLIGLTSALLVSHAAVAGPTLVTNPYLPYPPACGRMPDPNTPGGLEAQAVKFFDQVVQFYTSKAGEQVPLTLRAYRAPCSEANRSLIWLELILAAQFAGDDGLVQFSLPSVAGEIAPDRRTLMSLASEPNGWGSEGWIEFGGTYLISEVEAINSYFGSATGDRRWVFLLDNGPPPSPWRLDGYSLTPTAYNSAFKLVLRYNPYDFMTIDVPATSDILPSQAADMPLSGRLSGNWVISGASDQGVLMSISEKVLPKVPDTVARAGMPMVVFVAHYTFDSQGNMLWLTGAAEIDPGQSQVTIPIERVTNGEFRGSKPADREVIGSVTLEAHSCNDVTFDYDYSAIGLGSGKRRLERLFSLEIAGHDCRDFEAKVAANP